MNLLSSDGPACSPSSDGLETLIAASGRVERSTRRYPIGAEVVEDGVDFRVWAPRRRRVEVLVDNGDGDSVPLALTDEGNGYFSGRSANAKVGSLYGFRIDDGERRLADPASRFQPEGPLGPSQVIDSTFAWQDGDWPGAALDGQVIYELHIGTFTPAGTWRAAIDQLPALADVGITMLEVLPIADFAGAFGWGYDGVNLFAPTRLYGSPDDLRRFIDAAHRLKLAVILDVVYNHLGPVGNILEEFSDEYFTDRYETDWGKPLNFDGPDCEPVREYFKSNARYWIDEFHFDGLRLDATQNIYDFDTTHEHILAEVTRAARAAAAPRGIVVIAENEPQDVRLLEAPDVGGFGIDAMWNDDLHHAAMVALTGRKEAYYTDYHGNPQEFVSAAKYGFLYQGQRYKWQQQRRGTLAFKYHPSRFVNFLQNHDQIANSGAGERIHQLSRPAEIRAMTAYILLLPGTPMLFMGQEFNASAPFLYFADHDPELAEMVYEGRKAFLQQFRSLATVEMQRTMAPPAERATFERCKLDHSERERHAEVVRLHTDLLSLRRDDPVFRRQVRHGVDGACLGPGAFALRFFGETEDRLMLINLDTDLHLDPAPEPLLAPAPGETWTVLWSSEDPIYGGSGTPEIYGDEGWRLPGSACVLMRPAAVAEHGPDARAATDLARSDNG